MNALARSFSALPILLATIAVAPRARAQSASDASDATGTRETQDATPAPSLHDMPVDVRADEVTLDTHSNALDAKGNVRVDVAPFHLTSDRVRLKRSSIGVVMEGEGRLGFCACLGTPLAIAFDGATVAPPYDVVVRNPRLELLGVPVLWAPVFWLRAPARPGLLAPEIAYRGQDGVFAGEGVHVPMKSGDASKGALDLRAGGYVKGGAAVDAHLYTEATTTRIRWDRLKDDGVGVDARGASGDVAWQVDVLRGARGITATTDVDAAARPYDRARAEGAWRSGGWTLATAVRSVAPRGGDVLDLGAVGPVATARTADAIGGAGAYDASIEGGALRLASATRGANATTLSFARSEVGALLATRAGVFGASLAARGVGDVASDGVANGTDGAGSLRARVTLPLARGFPSIDEDDPWIHRIEPRLEAAALGVRNDGVLGSAFGRGGAAVIGPGGAWVATAGVANAVARWGSRAAFELDAGAGLVGDLDVARAAVRARMALESSLLRVAGESAHVFRARTSDSPGHAFLARARIGPRDSLHFLAHAAARDGVDPVLARALTDAPLEPSSGLLATEGYTGGAAVAIPWTRSIVTRGGADFDLVSGRLVAAGGAIELRDPCGCVVVRASGAHRIGRDGVDVWLTVDLPRAP